MEEWWRLSGNKGVKRMSDCLLVGKRVLFRFIRLFC